MNHLVSPGVPDFIVHRPVTSAENFSSSLGRVMICEDEVRGALLCVQDFVRSPFFTQQQFVTASHVVVFCGPWSHVETAFRSQVVAEVCGCANQAADWRMAVKDSQEQWYAVGGINSSSED